ncbi:MAG: hypothetical protein WAW37_06200 [Syntrophobacteraceae bacterium]
MAVQVGKFHKQATVTPGQKPVSSKAKSKPAQDKNAFSNLLSGIKASNKGAASSKSAASSLQHRPPTSMITNPGLHKASAGAKTGRESVSQSINNMAASALISLSALGSGQNRASGLYSTGAGISGANGPTPAQSYSIGTDGPGYRRSQLVGNLSAKFESGEKGPDIIGFDPRGGTSYGTYQISSRAGTMSQFIDYLSDKAPDLAQKLKSAGPANTGGRRGRMPEVWKQIAAQDPAKFSKLQYDFIEQSHYLPALQEISNRTGLDIGQSPKALKEVLWSTAVQHGPKGAAKIFTKAVDRSKAKGGGIQPANLINSIYSMRAGQFGSSTPDIRAAVRNRFKQEGRIALAMLSEPFAPDSVRA